jgi:putative IMPACT (imprinted ancient) family translation regulator
MKPTTREIDFGDGKEPAVHFQSFEKIIIDRRSVYSVSVGLVRGKDDIIKLIKRTKLLKNHNKATHHSWAVRIAHKGAVHESKNDGGELGAGNVILNVLQKKNYVNIFICVTRWYGGIKLQGDRFRHIQDSTLYAILNT